MANGNFGGGTGSKTDPYLVEDAEDLKNCIRFNVYYKQTRDIDLSAYTEGAGWIPVRIEEIAGSNYAYYYNGNGKKILNMYQNTPTSYHTGVFRIPIMVYYTSYVYSCEYHFSNIVVVNANVIGLSAGILMSGKCYTRSYTSSNGIQNNIINVTNCFISGTITSIIDKAHSLPTNRINAGIIGTLYDTTASAGEYKGRCIFRMKNTVAVMEIKIIIHIDNGYSFSLMSPLPLTHYGEYTITDCALHANIDVIKNARAYNFFISGLDSTNNSATTIYNTYVNVSVNKINDSTKDTVHLNYFTGDPAYKSNLIANHERGQATSISYDGRHYLTTEQMKDLSYYKALGWTVYEP